MKVLVVSTHPVPYGARAWAEWAKLDDHDLTVAFCSLAGATMAYDGEFSTTYRWDTDVTSGYKWLWLGGGSNETTRSTASTRNVVNAVRLVRNGAFDLVVCLGYRSPVFAASLLTARLVGAMTAVGTDAHADPVALRTNGFRTRTLLRRNVLPRVYRALDAVFVASERGRSYHESLGLRPEKVFLVRNTTDTEFFGNPRPEALKARSNLGVGTNRLLVLFAGKLVPWKRPADIVRAMALLPDAHAVFVGSGILKNELNELADELEVGDRVTFVGFQPPEQLAVLYQAADVLVLPSSREPFGLVVGEAFAAGTPAVVSDACGAAGELVDPGQTGLIFPCGDVPHLAAALRQLHDEKVRLTMAAKAQTLMRSWSPPAGADDLARALDALSRTRPDVGLDG